MPHSGADPLGEVKVKVSVELAHTRMSLDEALALGENSVVKLDRLAGERVRTVRQKDTFPKLRSPRVWTHDRRSA